MRDYLGYRVHLALKRLVTGVLRLGLALGVGWRPSAKPLRVTGSVVLLDRCLGLGDALMISPALRLLAPLGPVTVVTALPPLLAWDGEWRQCRDWAAMVAAVRGLAAEGRLVLVPRLGVGGLLRLLAWPGGVPAGVVWLNHRAWLETTSGRRGRIDGQHYTDGALAMARALRALAGQPVGDGPDQPDQPDQAAPERLPPRLPPDSIAATLAGLGLGGPRLVALAPWATSRIRRWPLEHWRALIERLAAAQPESVFVLLGSAEERPAGEAIRSGIAAQATVANLMGRLSLGETAAVIAGSALLIACDNGLMHFGLGLDTPLVALFGSTDPAARLCGERWRLAHDPGLCPQRRAPCYPDLHRDPSCPTAIECLSGLTPERVAALALALYR